MARAPARPRTTQTWLLLFVVARLVAVAIGAVLVGWDGLTGIDAVLLLYGVVSTALFVALPGAAPRSPSRGRSTSP